MANSLIRPLLTALANEYVASAAQDGESVSDAQRTLFVDALEELFEQAGKEGADAETLGWAFASKFRKIIPENLTVKDMPGFEETLNELVLAVIDIAQRMNRLGQKDRLVYLQELLNPPEGSQGMHLS